MNSRMQYEFTFNNSGINEYIKMDDRGNVIQRLFVYEEGGGSGGGSGSGRGGGGGGGGGISSARVPELLGSGGRASSGAALLSTARVPELLSTARVPELLRRPGGRRTRKNKNRK